MKTYKIKVKKKLFSKTYLASGHRAISDGWLEIHLSDDRGVVIVKHKGFELGADFIAVQRMSVAKEAGR